VSDWEKTGYIEVADGYCDYRACGNNHYLTACHKLVYGKPEKNGRCTVCNKPIYKEAQE